jgi:8-oxo-dGTP pyrophosphatase MutT (NUDIX family)
MKLTTLCYPIVDGRVLLAMKKRGFGTGKWNGAGGKVEAGERIEEACRRETVEEMGVTVGALEHRGVARFFYEGRPDWDNECHVFIARDVQGDPVETEEMRPQWYALDQVPYALMWEDDPLWLPDVLAGGRVDRAFYFNADGKLMPEQAGSSPVLS